MSSSSSSKPCAIYVMGPSGCGKSTIGRALAQLYGIPFVDGDSVHTKEAQTKMGANVPLVDEDRWPWLARVREVALALTTSSSSASASDSKEYQASSVPFPNAAFTTPLPPALARAFVDPETEQPSTQEEWDRTKMGRPGVVIACSALKKVYRNVLRSEELNTCFVLLQGTPALLTKRMAYRPGHYMGPLMLASQLATLQPPNKQEEPDTVAVELGKGEDGVEEVGVEGVRDAASKGAAEVLGL